MFASPQSTTGLDMDNPNCPFPRVHSRQQLFAHAWLSRRRRRRTGTTPLTSCAHSGGGGGLARLQTLQLPPRERLRATRVVALLMVPEGGNTERGRCFRFWKEAVVQHNGKISFEASEVPVEASRVLP